MPTLRKAYALRSAAAAAHKMLVKTSILLKIGISFRVANQNLFVSHDNTSHSSIVCFSNFLRVFETWFPAGFGNIFMIFLWLFRTHLPYVKQVFSESRFFAVFVPFFIVSLFEQIFNFQNFFCNFGFRGRSFSHCRFDVKYNAVQGGNFRPVQRLLLLRYFYCLFGFRNQFLRSIRQFQHAA